MESAGAKQAEDGRQLPVRKVRHRMNRFLATGEGVQPYYFTARQIRFLDVYSRTLDIEEACRQSELPLSSVKKNDYLQTEMQLCEQAALCKHRVQSAMGHHQRLMVKFERDYDRSGDAKFRSGIASTLARMSEATLRAEGEFSDEKRQSGVTAVQVVINIGDPPDGCAGVVEAQAEVLS